MVTAGTASDDTIFGTEGDDRLKGKQGEDTIYGQGGDDWINGNRDDDTLFGGDGDDELVGYSGDDVLIGGQGGPSTTGHDMLLGHSGDDILQMASTDGDGMANGGVGNDEYHLTAMTGLGQYHTFEVSGSDTFNLKFSGITDFSHGHHIRGDKNGETSADIFDFQDTGQVSDVVVGRLEDFDPSRDKIAIEGNTLDLGNLPDGVRIVGFDVDPTDTAVGKQQWLLIETEAGGHIFYALEGALVTIEGDGTANGRQHESHFLLEEHLPDFDQLNDIPYVDPKHFVTEQYAISGVVTNDVDETAEDVLAPINVENGDATENADLIAAGINGDIINAGGGDDRIWGGSGRDTIFGGNGQDTIFGGDGDDFLNPGAGLGSDIGAADSLHGGEGSDTFFIDAADSNVNAIVFDSGDTGQDRLELEGIDIDELSINLIDIEEEQALQLAWEDGEVLLAETGSMLESIKVGGDVFDGDVLVGGGQEPLVGNRDANILVGDGETSTLKAGNGDDLIASTAPSSNISGGGGADTVLAGHGDDAIWTHGGDDVVVLQGGENTVFAGAGDDILSGGGQTDALFGNAGDDALTGEAGDDGLNGGAGDDTLEGGAGVDWLFGGDGADILRGGTHTDALFGQDGRDALSGGAGDDGLDGGYGNDLLEGGSGVDWLYGGFGDDELHGAASGVDSTETDALFGQGGDDTLFGGGGGDNLDGGAGDDSLNGGDGDDWLFGQSGNDALHGGAGSDVLFAGSGSDTLFGGAGGDALDGGDGEDFLQGGAGVDVLVGGADADTFSFVSPGEGEDLIRDFVSGTDMIALQAAAFGLAAGALTGQGAWQSGSGLPGDLGASGPALFFDTFYDALWFDANGNDSGNAVALFSLETGILTEADVMLV